MASTLGYFLRNCDYLEDITILSVDCNIPVDCMMLHTTVGY
jgi:hypothetical protein